jgi:hypothetical protein
MTSADHQKPQVLFKARRPYFVISTAEQFLCAGKKALTYPIDTIDHVFIPLDVTVRECGDAPGAMPQLPPQL